MFRSDILFLQQISSIFISQIYITNISIHLEIIMTCEYDLSITKDDTYEFFFLWVFNLLLYRNRIMIHDIHSTIFSYNYKLCFICLTCFFNYKIFIYIYNFSTYWNLQISKNTIDIQRTYNWKNINLCVTT